MKSVIPKAELKRIIRQFLQDKDRGISLELFAELCGVNSRYLNAIFLEEKAPLSEYIQLRVSKGYKSWLKGEVGVYQNRDHTRFIEYRRQPKLMLERGFGLKVVNGEIKMDVGIRNKADYTGLPLDKQLERG
jgi:hypothetical protein